MQNPRPPRRPRPRARLAQHNRVNAKLVQLLDNRPKAAEDARGQNPADGKGARREGAAAVLLGGVSTPQERFTSNEEA